MSPIGCICKRALGFHYFESAIAANRPLPLLQQLAHDSSPALRFLSSTSQNQNQCEEKGQYPNTLASYLVNSCGLTPDSAIHASKRVRSVNLEKPVAVIHLLKTHGFSLTQISGMVRKFPRLIHSNPEKTLLPKLNYIYSVGASKADVVRIFSNSPIIFGRSLEKHIIPAFDLVRDLTGTNKTAIAAVRTCGRLLYTDLESNFIQNVKVLRYERAPESRISYIVWHSPNSLLTSSHHFAKTVEKVKTFGFSSSSPAKFVNAVIVMTSVSESTWEKKLRIFQRWGWSVDLTYQAFRRFPNCLSYSEKKINAGMHFFVNDAGVEVSYIAQFPNLLGYSLEKRLIPRYTIKQILLSRGFLMKFVYLSSWFIMSNKDFKDKFVIPYLTEAPELLDLYHAKSKDH